MVAIPTFETENALFDAGARLIIGLDEVGRGAIAGPVMVGACVLEEPRADFPDGLRDSKLISEKKRESLYPAVLEWATVAVGVSSVEEIESLGINHCLGLAGRRALIELYNLGIDVGAATVLVDGSHDWLSPVLAQPLKVVTKVKADQDCVVVAAASVVAKVTRDRIMTELHDQWDSYGWFTNKGYGSSAHLDALKTHGLSPHHRASWVNV